MNTQFNYKRGAMNILSIIGDFLLSEWLWGMTYGWIYFFTSLLIMAIALKYFLSLSFLKSALLSCASHIFSFLVFSFLVIGVFIYFFQWWYVPDQHVAVAGPFIATLFLACMYTVCHMLFFMLLSKFYTMPASRIVMAVCTSSFLSFVLSYLYLVKIVKVMF